MTETKNNQAPKAKRVNIRKLNPGTIIFIIGLVILGLFLFNTLNTGFSASEVSLTQFVNSIKGNQYSQVDIRDDGKAVATNKYVLGADIKPDFVSVQDQNTRIINSAGSEYEEIDLNQLYDLMRPLSFKELVEAITNPRNVKRVTEVFVSDDFIVAQPANPAQKDYLINKTGADKFREMLSEKGISADELPVKIDYLRSALGLLTQDDYAKFYKEGKFTKVWIVNDTSFALLKPENVKQEFVYWQVISQNFTDFLQNEGVNLGNSTVEFKSSVIPQIPWGDLITIGILVGFGFLALMMFRGIQGSGNSLMKFGQSKARMIFGRRPDITFKDVAGVDEAKEELKEIVLFLKEPKRFLAMGARIPKGLLMVGAPGTGKTLLARAIAGEAGVPFFHTSGSEFEEMLVGAGASRVRDLFEKAKRAAPSIIFIDEIDAVARKRGTTVQSSTTEQTLNQILVEMDGFEKNTNVIVVAATNRPDVLDPAILRPGRFDRRVVLDLPDIEGRKQILAIHAKNKPIAKNVDMEKVAKRTVGFSGADIENMLNEAAIIVAKDNRHEILFDDIEEAANKVQMGPAKKRKRTDKELNMTAYHEAGHALVMKLSPEHDPVHRVTIVSRGMALGYTMPLPEGDEVSMSKTKMLSKIRSLVAGFAAEELIFGDVTSGASSDIEKATSLARRMVKNFGMSKKLGLVKYGEENELQYLGYGYGEQRDYSEETAKIIDEEVRSIMNKSFDEATKMLVDHRKILDNLVKVLLDKEVIDNEEFNKFFPAKKIGK
jgi:cell division protease FtsH